MQTNPAVPPAPQDVARPPDAAGHLPTFPAALTLVLLVAAAAPRLWQLGRVLTVDENLWYERSTRFLQALVTGNLADTVLTGHPGVTTMWSGTLGLLLYRGGAGMAGEGLDQYAARLVTMPATLDALYWLRLPLVVLSTFMIVAAFLLARRLIGTWAAFAGAGLMALEPLFLAHSRSLHHDAPATDFSLLAVLCWLLYLKDGRRRYLWLAALGIGLATLSKISCVYLLGFAGLTLLPRLWRAGRFSPAEWRRVLLPGLALFTASVAVAVVAWPALWSDPLGTMKTVAGFIAAESGAHANGTFFLGHAVPDAGPLYYPVSLAFALTPLTFVGIFLALAGVGLGNWRRRHVPAEAPDELRWATWLLVCGLLFVVYMSLIGKKQERYVLPGVVVLDLAAGWGWMTFLGFARQRWSPPVATGAQARRGWLSLVPVVLLLGQAAFVWPTAPYYSTFFSPLFGGGKAARELVLIGRGEGLDRAVNFIRSAAGPELDQVASWYGTTVAVLFDDRVDVSDTAHPQYVLASDYVIIYVNQLQRELLKPSIWRYLNRQPPLDTVTLSGVDYAYVFSGKNVAFPVDPYAGHNRLAGKASLTGFDLDSPPVAGAQVPMRLYWIYEGMAADEKLYVALLDDRGRVWGQGDCVPDDAFGGRDTWQDEDILESLCRLEVVSGTPPGDYLLRAGVEAADGTQIGLMYPSPDEATIAVGRPAVFPNDDEIAVQRRIGKNLLPEVDLIGFDVSASVFKPGESLDLTLWWRAGGDLAGNYRIAIEAKGRETGQYAAWTGTPVDGRYPTTEWRAGEVVRDPWRLVLPASLPGGDYRLSLAVLDSGGNVLATEELTPLTVEGRPHAFALESPPANVQVAGVEDFAVLLGYDMGGGLQGNRLLPGQPMSVTLTWQARATPDKNYVVFVQLLNAAGQVRAQHDGQPADNTLITSTWAPGEYVRDSHSLQLPADLEPGPYRLIVGMYLADSGERLAVTTVNGEPLGDALTLDQELLVK